MVTRNVNRLGPTWIKFLVTTAAVTRNVNRLRPSWVKGVSMARRNHELLPLSGLLVGNPRPVNWSVEYAQWTSARCSRRQESDWRAINMG